MPELPATHPYAIAVRVNAMRTHVGLQPLPLPAVPPELLGPGDNASTASTIAAVRAQAEAMVNGSTVGPLAIDATVEASAAESIRTAATAASTVDPEAGVTPAAVEQASGQHRERLEAAVAEQLRRQLTPPTKPRPVRPAEPWFMDPRVSPDRRGPVI